MTRIELTLTMLAMAEGRPFSPVQIQKSLFLTIRNFPDIVSKGDTYDFVPYDYGPFDKAVYEDINELQREGLAEISFSAGGRWREYRATRQGRETARPLIEKLSKNRQKYLTDVCAWVRSLSFPQLVSAIYKSYPEMRANSIFSG